MVKVLSFCGDEIPSAVLGINNIFKYISNKIGIGFTFKKTHMVKSQDIIESDIVICIRGATDLDKNIIKLAKQYNRLIIYYLDDDLLNIPKYSICAPFYENPRIRENINHIMKDCNILWTSNPNIKKKYGFHFNRSYLIDIPVDIKGVHDTYLKEKAKNSQTVKICFAGSLDHVYMFDNMLASVVNDIAEKYKNKVYVYIIGIKPKKIKKFSNIKVIEYFNNIEDYYKFVKKNKFDIGLAPLDSSDFNSCKYYNKFLDYTRNGMVGVYSDVEPYNFIVKNKFNGILAKNDKDSWKKELEALILSKELQNEIYENAVSLVEKNFSYEYIMTEVLKYIPEIKNKREYVIKKRNRKLEKKIDLGNNFPFFLNRVIGGFKVFGIKYLWIGGKKVPYKISNYLKNKLNYKKV